MPDETPGVLEASSIGALALEALCEDQQGVVRGGTSHGVFIQTSGRWLIFISFEPYRGPLTITLDQISTALQQASGEGEFRIAGGLLSFPNAGVEVSVKDSRIWEAQPPSASIGTIQNRKCRVENAARRIMQQRPEVGLSPLLRIFQGHSGFHPQGGMKYRPHWEDISTTQDLLKNRDFPGMAGLLPEFLGSGQGLTPSGDDFVLGLLLSLNRWREPRFSDDDLSSLNRAIVAASYNRTTRISANLIECASLGQADERLIDAVDYLVAGEERNTDVISHLLSWGSSSGVDAFIGMAVALLSY